jgi:hypothetical protein
MFSDQEFLAAIDGSHSWSQVARNLGLARSGPNFKTLQRRAGKLGVDISTVETGRTRGRKPLEDLLQENVDYSSKQLRIRLVEAGLLVNICQICSLGPIWNGKPLVLQLDHIDGVHTNNKLDNLRILCPNCHTQTDTWGGTNPQSKLDRACPKCGGYKSKISIHCRGCRVYPEVK